MTFSVVFKTTVKTYRNNIACQYILGQFLKQLQKNGKYELPHDRTSSGFVLPPQKTQIFAVETKITAQTFPSALFDGGLVVVFCFGY